MSFAAERWAWDQKCANGVAKSVLALLAFMAGRDNGECYPSIETIVKATQHTERAVRKAIGQLIADGLISREERKTKEGRVTSPTYRVFVSHEISPEKPTPAPAKTPPLDDPAPAKTHPLNGVPAPAFEQGLNGSSSCENDSPAPAKTHPEPFLEPSKKEKRENHTLTLESGSARKRVCDSGFDQFWDSYPRKIGKSEAQRAWGTAIGKASADQILLALAGAQWASDPRYIPYPAKWLNGERWLDEVDGFDPVLRALGLSPTDFLHPGGLLQ